VNTWIVSRAARSAGLKVCLSGLGGDELFAGYDTFRRFGRLLKIARWFGPWRVAPRALLRRNPFSHRRSDATVRKIAWLLSEGGDLVGSYAVLRALFAPEQAAALWPRFDPERGYRRYLRNGGATARDPVNALSRLELSNYLRGTLLRDTDAMSMSHGLEVRPPLLDERLAEVVLALPGRRKLQRGVSKPLLWSCVAKELPAWLPRRRKTGFSLPFDLWLDGPLRDWHREGLRAAMDLGLSTQGERELTDARAHGGLAWHRWFAPAVLGHWAARNSTRANFDRPETPATVTR
jgi:asparagine synthase (glutamine-hydrolysing)